MLFFKAAGVPICSLSAPVAHWQVQLMSHNLDDQCYQIQMLSTAALRISKQCDDTSPRMGEGFLSAHDT